MSRPIPLTLFFRGLWVKILLGVSIILNASMWMLVYFQVPRSPLPIYLHHTVYFGVDWIGQWWMGYLFPAMALLGGLINVFLAWILFKNREALSFLLLATTALLQIFFLMPTILIMVLNS